MAYSVLGKIYDNQIYACWVRKCTKPKNVRNDKYFLLVDGHVQIS